MMQLSQYNAQNMVGTQYVVVLILSSLTLSWQPKYLKHFRKIFIEEEIS